MIGRKTWELTLTVAQKHDVAKVNRACTMYVKGERSTVSSDYWVRLGVPVSLLCNSYEKLAIMPVVGQHPILQACTRIDQFTLGSVLVNARSRVSLGDNLLIVD